MMSAEPPLIVLGMMRRADGSHKDSAANILATKEFVVNLVRHADAPAMNITCIDSPPEFDEAAYAGVALAASSVVRPDRIASAPVSMECRLHEVVEAGLSTILLGEVLRFHIQDALIDADRLYVDTLGLDLVARMHGAGWYTRSTDLFQLDRPPPHAG